jgi:hypothetical protein
MKNWILASFIILGFMFTSCKENSKDDNHTSTTTPLDSVHYANAKRDSMITPTTTVPTGDGVDKSNPDLTN